MRFALAVLALPLAAQTYAPNIVYSAGGGAITAGHGGAFAYWSVSKYLTQNSYATVINEYTVVKNQVLTCPLAGVSHVAYQVSFLSFGLTGAGGACSGDSNGGTGAASGQGFVAAHIHGSWSVIATARKTFIPNGNSAIKLSLGIAFGK